MSAEEKVREIREMMLDLIVALDLLTLRETKVLSLDYYLNPEYQERLKRFIERKRLKKSPTR